MATNSPLAPVYTSWLYAFIHPSSFINNFIVRLLSISQKCCYHTLAILSQGNMKNRRDKVTLIFILFLKSRVKIPLWNTRPPDVRRKGYGSLGWRQGSAVNQAHLEHHLDTRLTSSSLAGVCPGLESVIPVGKGQEVETSNIHANRPCQLTCDIQCPTVVPSPLPYVFSLGYLFHSAQPVHLWLCLVSLHTLVKAPVLWRTPVKCLCILFSSCSILMPVYFYGQLERVQVNFCLPCTLHIPYLVPQWEHLTVLASDIFSIKK